MNELLNEMLARVEATIAVLEEHRKRVEEICSSLENFGSDIKCFGALNLQDKYGQREQAVEKYLEKAA